MVCNGVKSSAKINLFSELSKKTEFYFVILSFFTTFAGIELKT